ncbi:MAG: methionyl-tRNA formyltransferase [Rickettsiales bacterium]|nr:methionyl-tRNA formyltransferase [Rickettsiales bacterium]
MKLVFMGAPDFAIPTLKALIASDEHEVVAVYSQPPRPAGRGHKEQPTAVHALALEHDIPVHTPTSLKTEESQETFRSHDAVAAIVVAYGLLLPKPILEAYPFGCINVHPSALPRWRGAAPIQRTILAGDTSTAMCIMQMDEGLDTGDVLWRQEVDVLADMTAGELHDQMAALGAHGVLEVLGQIPDLSPTPQSEDGATYAHKISKDEAMIDWSASADAIYNHIRGMNPYPAALSMLDGERIKIFTAEKENASGDAGVALDDTLLVACGDGALRITELQRAGKRRMMADEYLRGYPCAAGTKLG